MKRYEREAASVDGHPVGGKLDAFYEDQAWLGRHYGWGYAFIAALIAAGFCIWMAAHSMFQTH